MDCVAMSPGRLRSSRMRSYLTNSRSSCMRFIRARCNSSRSPFTSPFSARFSSYSASLSYGMLRGALGEFRDGRYRLDEPVFVVVRNRIACAVVLGRIAVLSSEALGAAIT